MDNFEIDLEQIQRMLVVYNAVLNGWTVRSLGDNKLEFKKKKDKEIRDIMALSEVDPKLTNADCLNHFVKTNTKMDSILKK